jgi:predicted SAM-dependent methyltransferase
MGHMTSATRPRAPFVRRLVRPGYRRARAIVEERRLRKHAAQPDLRIVVGASGDTQPGWIATEVEFLDLLDDADWRRYFRASSLRAILAEHVWEHLTPGDAAVAAETCFRYLRSGGYVRAAVPDGLNPDPQYIEWVRVGGVGPGADDHKVLYDHRSFSAVFESAGFRVRLLEFFDGRGAFHHHAWDPEDGLIQRSLEFDPRNRFARRYTSLIIDATKK